MENETKNVLMQYLFRFAEHYNISPNPLPTFKKREALIDRLTEVNPDASLIIQELFNAFIIADRIACDKEKYDKARPLWDAEHQKAEHDKVEAEMQLIKFCKDHQIQVGQLEKA